MASLSICNLSKNFTGRRGDHLALQEVSLEIKDGEFMVFVGPSGCGKSTMLNLLAGLDKPTSGELYEGKTLITSPGRSRSMVFQEGALFPWLTAQRNIEFGLKQMGKPRKERADLAEYYLHLVHLLKFRDNYLHELSGGMRQRVAIARALALDPEALLMDEPFSALDAQTREGLYGVLQEIWERTRKTIVFVTHNVREAVCLADRVALFDANPGRIKEVFSIDLPRPRQVDDEDVHHLAHRISTTLRTELVPLSDKEYDEDWKMGESGVLRPPTDPMGDNI